MGVLTTFTKSLKPWKKKSNYTNPFTSGAGSEKIFKTGLGFA